MYENVSNTLFHKVSWGCDELIDRKYFIHSKSYTDTGFVCILKKGTFSKNRFTMTYTQSNYLFFQLSFQAHHFLFRNSNRTPLEQITMKYIIQYHQNDVPTKSFHENHQANVITRCSMNREFLRILTSLDHPVFLSPLIRLMTQWLRNDVIHIYVIKAIIWLISLCTSCALLPLYYMVIILIICFYYYFSFSAGKSLILRMLN